MTRVLSFTAWPYANGPRHIGHVAGVYVPADVFSRYLRMSGHDVLMASGSDEHGTPILIAADEAGMTPQALADQNHRVIAEDMVSLGISYDLYTRRTATSSSRPPTGRSRRRRGARCRTATSRAPARSAATTARGATSATTAATSWTRRT
jgi:hypothetical protein